MKGAKKIILQPAKGSQRRENEKEEAGCSSKAGRWLPSCNASWCCPTSFTTTHNKQHHIPDYGQNQGFKFFDRARETSSSGIPDDGNRNIGEIKKKRKPEYDVVDTQANLPKAPLPHGREAKAF
ncbi:wound-responsive family protein [Zea mays]|uniref:Wound-responsive family protein n=2 Tax=Zea mays TaxID=4577 RepID=A0A1D6G7H9_MAIZE|nr:wound-responsive family protein [Zea mays]